MTEEQKIDMEREEICKQPYKNMVISAGLIWNKKHLLDSIYLQITHDKREKNSEWRLAPDEAQAIIWVLSGTLFSWLLTNLGRRKMRRLIKERINK